MQNDIFVTPSLPLLIAEGKQAAIDSWVYQCMFLVQQERLKPLGLSQESIVERINDGFKKSGIIPLSPTKTGNHQKSTSSLNSSGPLRKFFK